MNYIAECLAQSAANYLYKVIKWVILSLLLFLIPLYCIYKSTCKNHDTIIERIEKLEQSLPDRR